MSPVAIASRLLTVPPLPPVGPAPPSPPRPTTVAVVLKPPVAVAVTPSAAPPAPPAESVALVAPPRPPWALAIAAELSVTPVSFVVAELLAAAVPPAPARPRSVEVPWPALASARAVTWSTPVIDVEARALAPTFPFAVPDTIVPLSPETARVLPFSSVGRSSVVLFTDRMELAAPPSPA